MRVTGLEDGDDAAGAPPSLEVAVTVYPVRGCPPSLDGALQPTDTEVAVNRATVTPVGADGVVAGTC